jgi:hypothetical protein
MSDLQHPGISARTLREPRPDLIEERVQDIIVMNLPRRKPPRVQISSLRQRDQLLRERPKFLGLRGRGLNPTVAKEADRHVSKQCLPVARCPPELPPPLAMSHCSVPFLGIRLCPVSLGVAAVVTVVRTLRPPEGSIFRLLQPHPEPQTLVREELADLLQ